MRFYKTQDGFSLIEVIVVVAIMATMMSVTATFIGDSFHTQIKKEISHLNAALRYSFNQAVTQKNTYRLVFDLTEQTYWVESTMDDFLIDLNPDASSGDKPKPASEEPDAEAGDEKTAPPVATGFAADEENVVKKVKLKDTGVVIKDVYVEHQRDVLNQGKAYLYFFPQGFTEQAIIHFTDEEDEAQYSVIVNPITAKPKVVPEYVTRQDLEK